LNAGTSHHIPIRGIALVLGFALAAVLAGCAGNGHGSLRTEVHPYSAEEKAMLEQARRAEYRLHPGDQVDIVFDYAEGLDQSGLVVLPDGQITLGGIGSARAAGLTVAEFDSVLTASFAENYRDPSLSVVVRSLAEKQVYVLGEVGRPGLTTLPQHGASVLQAIAAAGGFTSHADPAEAVVIRVTPDGYVYRHCDLSHLEKGGLGMAGMVVLSPFDVIYVPRSPIGDLAFFTKNVLGTVLDLTDLYWDIYAMSNLDKVDRLTR